MNTKLVRYILLICVLGISLGIVSCRSLREVSFADEVWRVSTTTGNIVNADSTLQFTLGNHMPSYDATIISNIDSLLSYPGSAEYISRILTTCGLGGARVCFYIPSENTMWVKLPVQYVDVKPRAVTYNLADDKPYTMWVWDNDVYNESRTDSQIYSNAYVDQRFKTLIVVDKLTYGTEPMACLNIYQSATKRTSKLGFRPDYWANKPHLLDYSSIDILSHWVDSRRETIIENYKLGQEVKSRRAINTIKNELKEILRLDQEPRERIVEAWHNSPQDTALHVSIAAEILRNDSINLVRVCDILDNYPLIFGEENEVLWVVIQHSSLELQKHYLPKFIAAARKGLLRGELVAVMQDRIACWSGKPQVYGSQGTINDNGIFVPSEIEDIENVNARRSSMGMVSLEEYIKQMSNPR